MYKKIARIGPISFGIFYALLTLLMVIIMALIGMFVLPMIPMAEGMPQLDMFSGMSEQLMAGENLAAVGMSLGMMVLFSFVAGLILAILYNIVAAITGGVKVRVTDIYDDI